MIKPEQYPYTDFPKQSENAEWLLQQRYCVEHFDDKTGEMVRETSLHDVATRVSKIIAAAESIYTDDLNRIADLNMAIYRDIMSHRFLFNSPALFNAGVGMVTDKDLAPLIYKPIHSMTLKDYKRLQMNKKDAQQLFACFVIGVEDSIEGIFDSVKDAAIISKYGGGVGANFGKLREKNAKIRGGSSGVSSGPVSFMETWNTMGSVVVQGGCIGSITSVATPMGPRKIRDLKPGDLVFSWDKKRNGFCTTPIKDAWCVNKRTGVLCLYLEDGTPYAMTPDHPVLLDESNEDMVHYVQAKDTLGLKIKSFNSEDAQDGPNVVAEIPKELLSMDVWDIEVPATGNFVICNHSMKRGIVVSNTRRSALMGMLDVDHPDILDFINAKTEEGRLPYFNISVAITDHFMECVKNDMDFDLISRVDGSVVKTVKARDLWNTLCEKAWMRGDPGIFFKDRANEDSLLKLSPEYEYHSTNPCCVGDTKVATPDGFKLASELKVGDTIVTVTGTGVIDEMEVHPSVPVFKVTFSDGESVTVTAAHQFQAINAKDYVIDGDYNWEFIRLSHLSVGDLVRSYNVDYPRSVLGGLNHGGTSVRIMSIKPAGREKVYDFHEPKTDTWITNGYVSRGCGEQPLPDYTSCNLGSINLSAFVDKDGAFDYKALERQVQRSIYYLDLVIDATSFPLKRIEERTKAIRPVGLGIMGLADAMIKQNIAFGSPIFETVCRNIARVLAYESMKATIGLADLKGALPEHEIVSELVLKAIKDTGVDEYQTSKWFDDLDEAAIDDFISVIKIDGVLPPTVISAMEHLEVDQFKTVLNALGHGQIRNSRRLTIAPTGSISMLFDTSAGIEPNFAWHWSRKIVNSDDEDGFTVKEYFHPLLTDKHRKEIVETGKISDPIFVSAHDVTPDQHVRSVELFSDVVDSGISKTVGLPSDASIDDVKNVYMRCYDSNCKGITVYRDGSRSGQPIETKKPEKKPEEILSPKVKDRTSNILNGKTIKDSTPWGGLYVTLNYDKGTPFEVFASLGKSGSEIKSMAEALSRVISIGLRSGCRLEDMVATMRGISGKEAWVFDCDDDTIIRSIPDGIAVLLEKLIGGEVRIESEQKPCPECGSPMELVGGCAYCYSCGYSPCK